MIRRKSGTQAASVGGFTLLELSVVLVLIGLIVGGGLVMFNASLQSSQYNRTVATMDAIDKALLGYSAVNNRIPCPADITLLPGSANYGLEAGATAGGTATGECVTGMTPAANFKSTGGAEEGGVPTRALQLPDDYMFDGWGHRLRYAVDPSVTKASALPYPAGGLCSPSASAITVNDSTGAARTTAGIYALISHGANGHGAYTSGGGIVNAGSVNTSELANCNCTSAGTFSGTYTPTYVQQAPTTDPANALDNFDDVVTFKEGWQMQAQNIPLLAKAQCTFIYVGDYANGRVVKFDAQGNFIANIGTGMVNGPSGIGVDSSGNIWVAEIFDNGRINKFSSSGTWLASLGNGGGCSSCMCTTSYAACASHWPYGGSSSPGQLGYPYRVFIDGSGNLWVTEEYGSRVQEFDSNGNFLQEFGSNGGGNGQFNNIGKSIVDGSGNVYVADWDGCGSSRVQKFNNNGSYISTITSGYCYVEGITFDQSGNIVVLTWDSPTIRKFDTSGNPLGTVVSGYFPTGEPMDIATDSSGNIYVMDTSTPEVVKFDKNGTLLKTFGSGGSGDGQFNCSGNFCGIGVSGR